MRLLIVGALLLLTSTAAAQSRWTVSAGPEWSHRVPDPSLRTWGLRLRAEYDLTKPNRVFGLRLESGARWSPSQGFGVNGDSEQRMDLVLGINASISPLPRARVSPYVKAGLYVRQEWLNTFDPFPRSSYTVSRGDIAGALGVGLRMRLGGHTFQLEYRQLFDQTGLTFGTRLPF